MKRIRPSTRRGFAHVARYRSAQGEMLAKILPGEWYVTEPPELITTLLGSCVAACIRDPEAGVGGMNHFMLPSSPADEGASAGRYGCFAMEKLINEILKAGGQRDRLEAKIFGGGHIGTSRSPIGAQNASFAEEYLEREGLRLVARDVGGFSGRKLIYDPGTGRARVFKLPPMGAASLLAEEQAYRRRIKGAALAGSVELF